MERQNIKLSIPKAILKKAGMLALKEEKSLSALMRGRHVPQKKRA